MLIIDKLFFYLFTILSVLIPLYYLRISKSKIKISRVVGVFIAQIIICSIILKSTFGHDFIRCASSIFSLLSSFSSQGAKFVFGSLADTQKNGFIFFFNVGMNVVLISSIIGIGKFLRITDCFFIVAGALISKLTGRNKIESANVISSFILGQSENFLLYKGMLHTLSDRTKFSVCATGISTVSLAILVSYMQFIPAKYIFTGIIMNMFNIVIVLTVINPEPSMNDGSHSIFNLKANRGSFFFILNAYIWNGFLLAVKISAALVGFIALITLMNHIFLFLFGMSFQSMISYIFTPISWLIGVANKNILTGSEIISTKIITNEFLAMKLLHGDINHLEKHSIAVLSTFLISFANLSSLGVMIGAIDSTDNKVTFFASRNIAKIFYSSLCVSILSASTVGLFV